MELEIIKNSIHEIRGKKVMLDMDLAKLYENAYVKSKFYMAVDSENPKKYQISLGFLLLVGGNHTLFIRSRSLKKK
jgi:hypothetical protein